MSVTRRIRAVAIVEILRLLRSRIAFTLLFATPALQVLLFGYAIQPTARAVTVAISADDAGTAARISQALRGQPGLTIVAADLRPGGAAALVRSGEAMIGVEAPERSASADSSPRPNPFRIVVDATDAPLTAAATLRIEAAYWRSIARRTLPADSLPDLRIERLYNPQSRADWTFLPSLVGVTVMIGMVMLGALSLAREREAGTWESLLVLPIRPIEVLAGKLLPHVLLGTVQGLLVLAAGTAMFHLPVLGSLAGLITLLPLFATANFVLGYAISARSATQLAALQGAVAFYLPAMLLSGFLYPFQAMPRWAQALGNIFPLTHFIRAAQGATLRGDDAGTVLSHGPPMLGFLAAVTAIALIAQARRLD